MKRSLLIGLMCASLGCGGAARETTSTTVVHADVVITTTNGYRVEGTSTWEGRYVCTQGVTGLTLELRGTGGTSVSATFQFYGVPENPGVPTGAYVLTGVIRGDGTIELVPDHWLAQPERYVMVGMWGVLDRASGVMRGAITNPACAEFDLHRVR